ncbi:hypothetical protein HYW74_01300 [Candidatus Pacearchaeota archaeon]|nr:hypothetical protein [Candidatus Pacearchaeota archaeon]
MKKTAYLRTDQGRFYCSTYTNGTIESEVSIPDKDSWDIPNLFNGLIEHNYKIIFTSPP